MGQSDINVRVRTLATLLTRSARRLATAESCTGGLVAAALTTLAGSSNWFERGWVTYSNAAKTEALGVDASLIAEYGAVSEAVAAAMASGARTVAGTEYALAVTGIAGPDGGSPVKPVGTVCFGWAFRPPGREGDEPVVEVTTRHFDGERRVIRFASARVALVEGLARLERQLTERPPVA